MNLRPLVCAVALSLVGVEQTSAGVVSLDAKPEPVSIDPAKTAIIVVDMENDFAAKGGMFDRAGIDIAGAQRVIAPIAKVLAAGRQAGIRVIYLKMRFRPDLSDLGAPDSVNRWERKSDFDSRYLGHRHCPGTSAAGPRHRPLQDSLQRFLSNRPEYHVEKAEHQISNLHRSHYEHLRRVDSKGCNVQRLSLCFTIQLCQRADRAGSATKQSRCISAGTGDTVRLDIRFRTVS